MKATVVPAQVTTVEDRVMGSLGFSQLLLLVAPVVTGGLLYVVLPPFNGASLYKLAVIFSLFLLFGSLAIRIKGKIVLFWLLVILRYNLRPKYYVFNKNSTSQREQFSAHDETPKLELASAEKTRTAALPQLGFHDMIRALAATNDPARQLRFEATKKGGLSVRFTEVEEQS